MSAQRLLQTDRLELWKPQSGDFAQLFAIHSHPETSRYLGPTLSKAESFSRFQRNAGSWMLHGYGLFIVRRKDTSEIIGNCGIFHSLRGLGPDIDNIPEGAWIFAHDHVGKGYASEAMQAVFGWFDRTFGLRRTVCMIDPANAPSIHLAEKLGFTPMRTAILDDEPVALFERVAAP